MSTVYKRHIMLHPKLPQSRKSHLHLNQELYPIVLWSNRCHRQSTGCLEQKAMQKQLYCLSQDDQESGIGHYYLLLW